MGRYVTCQHPRRRRALAAMIIRGRLLETSQVATVAVEGPRVESVELSGEEPGAPQEGELLISPGLIDLQVNGLTGHDLNVGVLAALAVQDLVAGEWAAGVTAFCPTLTTAPEAELVQRLAAIASVRNTTPALAHSLLTVHVEGPFISPLDGPRGAHSRAAIRAPDEAEVGRWTASAGGLPGIVTLAPERPGALSLVRSLAEQGVVVAIAHTAASKAEIEAAVNAGATLSTHLGNGCAELLHRHHNPIWPQLADDRLCASFIADGAHLPPEALVAMVRAKGLERSILVSDSIATTGLPPGQYPSHGGTLDVGEDGVSRPTGSSGFAGGARTLKDCVSWIVEQGICSWDEAIRMASANPARLLGLDRDPGGRRGTVLPGAIADLALFRLVAGELRTVATFVRGEVVYRADGSEHNFGMGSAKAESQRRDGDE